MDLYVTFIVNFQFTEYFMRSQVFIKNNMIEEKYAPQGST